MSDELRASDAEREHAVMRLREASAEGRLTLEELAERSARAYAARTHGELARVHEDLPPAPTRTSRRHPVHWTVVPIGEAKRVGRWRVGRRTRVVVGIGTCVLDLREAELEGEELSVTVLLGVGDATIVVPSRVEVELIGLVLIGGKHERGRSEPPAPGAPFVRVRVVGLVGEVKVVRR